MINESPEFNFDQKVIDTTNTILLSLKTYRPESIEFEDLLMENIQSLVISIQREMEGKFVDLRFHDSLQGTSNMMAALFAGMNVGQKGVHPQEREEGE